MDAKSPPKTLISAVQTMGLVDQDDRWHPLYGGHSNQLWRIDRPNGAYVVKLYAPEWNNPLFGNSSYHEAMALAAYASYGFAPEYVGKGTAQSQDFIVYRHVSQSKTAVQPKDAGALLRRLHQNDVLPDGFKQSLPVQKDLTDTIYALTNGLWYKTRDLLYQTAKLMPMPVGQTVLHGDATLANFVTTDSGLILLDWQCPCVGDPCYDLALYLTPAMRIAYGFSIATPDEQAAVLEGYSDKAVVQRFLKSKAGYHALFAAYSFWQVHQGNAQYSNGFEAELNALQNIRNQ